MEKQIINTPSAPAPIGPYNQAVRIGDMLFISGQICLDPATGKLNNQDIQQETHQVMHNLRSILTAADMTFHNVVKTTIFITDMTIYCESIIHHTAMVRVPLCKIIKIGARPEV